MRTYPDAAFPLGIDSPRLSARHPALLARGDGDGVRGLRRPLRRAVRRTGRAGGLRSGGPARARAEPVPTQQRHHPHQPARRRRAHACHPDDARMPRDRAAHVRADRRRVRRLDRHRTAIARDRSRRARRAREQRAACRSISAASARATPSIWWRSCSRTGASSDRSCTEASARCLRSSRRPTIGGWPLTLSDPRDSSRVLARLSVRQTALGASGVRKKDHIVDPRSGEPVRGRLASWVTVPRPKKGEQGEQGEQGERATGHALRPPLWPTR